MQIQKTWGRALFAALTVGLLTAVMPLTAFAGTTGIVSGTVTDAHGAPLADVRVSAASASQSATATTDSHGFYSLNNLIPDTYLLSFQKEGYQPVTVPGVTVFQDQTNVVNQQMRTQLKTIATVRSSGASNLVKSNQGSDVYNVTGKELTAATNPVDTHETLYQYLAVTPGVTANGFPAQPRIRGGQVTDLGYEFEGIPIQDRIVGFFTSNLANIGINNIEVYTGGLSAAGSFNGTGYFNSVLKTGTYPGFSNLSVQASSPEFNNYLTVETGAATPNHRFSYYVGFDGVNSQNQYDYGEHSYPDVLYWDFNGPGPVKTRDWVSNFHFRPDPKDDIQLVATNSWGDFVFNYLAVKSPGEPPILGFAPCAGAVPGGNSLTGMTGGTSPSGASCTNTGLYWTQLSRQSGGNIYHHYGGLGKIQWNHNINENSYYDLRVAENFNQYIFDQPMAEVNNPALENDGGPYSGIGYGLPAGTCPAYPYAPGTPVASTNDGYDICAFDDGVNNFYGDRRSNIWLGALDYVNELNSNATIKAGVSDERDNNVLDYYLTNTYTIYPSGKIQWPGIFEKADYPTSRQEAYIEGDVHVGKFLLDPGLGYGQQHYGFPKDPGYANAYGGGSTQHVINPTFNGTYTFDPNDVLRFSWGNTTSFISSAYIYTTSEAQYTASGAGLTRNPFRPGTEFQPQLNHSADLMWEHNFGNGTTMRVGPYYNSASNYFNSYRPITGVGANGEPIFSHTTVLTNNNAHKTMGAEFALNHIDNRPLGMSYWLTATYDNFWTTAYDISGAFINTPLPQNLINAGVKVRAPSNPLWSGTLLTDFHSDRFHLDPLIYYQTDTFFNTGDIHCGFPAAGSNAWGYRCEHDLVPNEVAPYIATNELKAHGWWRINLSAYEELGVKRNLIVGFKADNLFDQVTDTTPCASNGTGCFPFDGPQSGIVDKASSYPYYDWIYQNYSQSPRTFYIYAGIKM